MTITEFLLARIAEDEAARVIDPDEDWWPRQSAEIAESERWKAECEAKRRIADLHRLRAERACLHCGMVHTIHGGTYAPRLVCGICPTYDGLCGTFKALAAVYADHPDYREEWRP